MSKKEEIAPKANSRPPNTKNLNTSQKEVQIVDKPLIFKVRGSVVFKLNSKLDNKSKIEWRKRELTVSLK